MCAQKLRLIFCLLVTAFLSDAQYYVDNQDIKEYFGGIGLFNLRWENPKSHEDFEKIIVKDDVHMLLLNVNDEGEVCGKSMQNIIEEYLETAKTKENKKGLVFSFASEKGFKKAIWNNPSEEERYTKDSINIPNLSPFPQWFHIQSDGFSKIKAIYDDNKNIFEPYTFSFDNCENINEGFEEIENKNVFVTSNSEFCEIDPPQLITVKNDEDPGLICLSNAITSLTSLNNNNENILFYEPKQNLNIHTRMCLIKKPLFDFENTEKATTTWKQINDFSLLTTDIKEDIIKIDVEDKDQGTMFLGTDFATFLERILSKLSHKGVQLNFKNAEALSAFVNLQNVPYSLFDIFEEPQIKIGLKFEDSVWDEVSKNKDLISILSCYSIALSAESGSGAYTNSEIEEIKKHAEKIKGHINPNCEHGLRNENTVIVVSFDLKRMSTSDPELIQSLESQFDTELSFTDTTNSTTKEEMRNLMRLLGSSEVYFDHHDSDIQKEVLNNVLITDLMPELNQDSTILNFVTVTKKDELDVVLEVENRMLELVVASTSTTDNVILGDDIELCEFLEKLDKNKKNGVKFLFDEIVELETTLNAPCFKFLNFPVWLELIVSDLVGSNLEEILLKQGHKIILQSTKDDVAEKVTELKNQRLAIIEVNDVGFHVEAIDLATKGDKVNALFERFNADMLLYHSSTKNFNSKDLRANLLKNKLYYANMKDKLVLEECPAIESSQNFEDFKNLQIAEFINGNRDDIRELVENFDMIRVKLTHTNDILFTDQAKKMSLIEFFYNFENSASEKAGIIFTIEDNTIYNEAMKFGEFKSFKHPIWIDLKVISSNRKAVILNHEKYNDRLDCRTLSLGIFTNAIYTEDQINQLIEYPKNIGNARVNVFDLKYIDRLEDIKNVKNVMLTVEDGHPFDAGEFRKQLAGLEKKDVAFDFSGSRKFAALDCPKNKDVLDYFDDLKNDDLSAFTLSNYITKLDDIETALQAKNHMLNILLTLNGKEVIVSENLSLLDLFKNVSALSNDSKIGLKLEFDTTETFETAINNPLILRFLKTLERPIWLSANIVGTDSVELDHKLNNDVLDCRTLTLGWSGKGSTKYSEENLQKMLQTQPDTDNKLYTIEMIYLLENFENIEKHLLAEPTTTTVRTKPAKEEVKKYNGNKLLVSFKEEDIFQLNADGLPEFLEEHKDLLFFDMTMDLKNFMFSGSASLGSGLFISLFLSLTLIVLQY